MPVKEEVLKITERAGGSAPGFLMKLLHDSRLAECEHVTVGDLISWEAAVVPGGSC